MSILKTTNATLLTTGSTTTINHAVTTHSLQQPCIDKNMTINPAQINSQKIKNNSGYSTFKNIYVYFLILRIYVFIGISHKFLK